MNSDYVPKQHKLGHFLYNTGKYDVFSMRDKMLLNII
jgi:hypothetical protein